MTATHAEKLAATEATPETPLPPTPPTGMALLRDGTLNLAFVANALGCYANHIEGRPQRGDYFPADLRLAAAILLAETPPPQTHLVADWPGRERGAPMPAGGAEAVPSSCQRIAAIPPPSSHVDGVRTVAELPMTAFADNAPQRDEFNGEQTILTYNDKVGVWDLAFFEAGEEFPEKWFGDTHWIDITGMWPGVIVQVASFATTEGKDNG